MQAAAVGSSFDYPLSSRFDENDSILVFDKCLIPWENVFVYDPERQTSSSSAQVGWRAPCSRAACAWR